MIYVIKIVNTHGLGGEVRALHYTDGAPFFEAVDTLYTAGGAKSYKVERWRLHKGAVLLKLAGVDDMTAAEALKGVELYAREEDLPPLPEGRYYYFQLTGLRAVLANGEEIGTVSAVTEGGGGDLLELTRADGGAKCLIPKCDAFVKEISLERGEIVIEPIEGLIDWHE